MREILGKAKTVRERDLTYEKKLAHYNTQNLPLQPQYYEHNPGFLRFLNESGLAFKSYAQFTNESGLAFKSYAQFTNADLEERGVLYRQIAERIWNPDDLLRETGA